MWPICRAFLAAHHQLWFWVKRRRSVSAQCRPTLVRGQNTQHCPGSDPAAGNQESWVLQRKHIEQGRPGGSVVKRLSHPGTPLSSVFNV